jgi:hypothetical protein
MNQAFNYMIYLYYPVYLLYLIILVFGLVTGPEKLKTKRPILKVPVYVVEFISIIVLPLLGISTNQDRCGEHPLDLNNLLTPYVCWGVSALGFYVSRYLKKQLPPLVLFLSSALVTFGFIYCAILTVHFGKFLTFFFMPLAGAEIFCPLVGTFFLGTELLSYKKFYSAYLERNKAHLKGGIHSFFARVLASDFFKRNSAIAGLLLPLVVLLQGILYLLGQAPDSLILQFTESCGFLLSIRQECSCPGDHYLCSVAAFGNKKLVKPTRNGIRGGKLILVNRQLLIANAFENWFEDHSPRLHKIMRKTYDAMNIPADKWARKKTIANFFYIVMKPAEWFFLLWLYLFDKKPETRIAKQYLPKNEIRDIEQINIQN